MAEFGLQAQTPLDGYREVFGTVRLEEPTSLAIVAVAFSQDAGKPLAEALQGGLAAPLPAPGTFSRSDDGAYRLVWMAPDQNFVLFDHTGPDAEAVVAAAVGDAGYVTDQTDNWAALRMTGAGCRDALERLCMLDLHPEAFTVGAAARTVMEHLGVILLCEAPDSYLLLSARSSARSFLAAVRHACR